MIKAVASTNSESTTPPLAMPLCPPAMRFAAAAPLASCEPEMVPVKLAALTFVNAVPFPAKFPAKFPLKVGTLNRTLRVLAVGLAVMMSTPPSPLTSAAIN